ncbi:sigma-70 family RNA polymerase sigma factor [Trinickia sp. Y13]|uniref:sigma-70 family RNA polymerase sigma factor n=1 Tax=Trinickia sp. Y13 TaxID=2917807 RepID=UPI0024049C00|nr:sigma-70 family RNA polymerase sigma factor [Trinickia sp. Y13]MDG0023226.1 sigma-70 family RNA polymerase sigma factor [Trinickia sp. Y13]
MTKEETDKISAFEAARTRLTSIAYRMLGSRAEAEDVVQDAWLKWHAAAREELRTPLAWLTTVTTRLAIDRIRRLQSEQAARASECSTQPWLDEWAPSAEDAALHASSVSEAVARLFERLSADERAAFVLHEAFDCDYAQIAEVVGKTPGHCRQLAHRARQRLQGEQARRADGRASRPAGEARVVSAERLREAIVRADAVAAMQLFATREPMVAAATCDAAGAAHARARASLRAKDASALAAYAAAEAHPLPSGFGSGIALVCACEVVAIVRVTPRPSNCTGKACAMAIVTDGPLVQALNARFGLRAIEHLLARIAGAAATATAGCAN